MGSRYNTDDNNYIKLYSFQSIFTCLFICELGNSAPGLDEAHINPSLALEKSVFSKGRQVLGGQSQEICLGFFQQTLKGDKIWVSLQ